MATTPSCFKHHPSLCHAPCPTCYACACRMLPCRHCQKRPPTQQRTYIHCPSRGLTPPTMDAWWAPWRPHGGTTCHRSPSSSVGRSHHCGAASSCAGIVQLQDSTWRHACGILTWTPCMRIGSRASCWMCMNKCWRHFLGDARHGSACHWNLCRCITSSRW